MAGKKRDLWSDERGTKSVNRPQPVTVAKGWKVSPDAFPAKKEAPRRRKYAPIRPNNRAAVAVPLAGQSYNPADDDHQAALKKAVKQLERKKKADTKFVKMMQLGRDLKIIGNFSADKTWEEEVCVKPTGRKQLKGEAVLKKEAAAKKKKEKKSKKLGKKGSEMEARRAMKHRHHPDRVSVVKEVDEIDKLVEQHAKLTAQREAGRAKRRQEKKENMKIKHYGRHYHTPLAVDVVPSDKLVGSLRNLNGGYIHPAMDRMKSLEERNLVPARMRHTYNKRSQLKPKGELRLKRETFGILPDTTF